MSPVESAGKVAWGSLFNLLTINHLLCDWWGLLNMICERIICDDLWRINTVWSLLEKRNWLRLNITGNAKAKEYYVINLIRLISFWSCSFVDIKFKTFYLHTVYLCINNACLKVCVMWKYFWGQLNPQLKFWARVARKPLAVNVE